MNKKELRKEMKQIRGRIPIEKRLVSGRHLQEALKIHPRFQAANRLALYLSFADELPTHQLINYLLDLRKSVYIPRIDEAEMRWSQLTGENRGSLKANRFGIAELEDMVDPEVEDTFDLVLVPGLAFDCDGRRLGYGGGYFDRFLQKHPQLYRIGIGFREQMVDRLPVEDHDIAMDEILLV